MAVPLEVESTLTDRYQTTVPEMVRRALRLGKRDKIHYTIRPNGEVLLILIRGQNETNDPWPSRQASQPLAVSAQAR